jgi:hypothetical protein
MAVAVLVTPRAMHAGQYYECLRRLEQAGAGAPPGRRFHACFGSGDQLRVFSIWDSQEAWDRFSRQLVPVLREVGINPGQPEFVEVVNTIPPAERIASGEPPTRRRARRAQ